MTEVDTTTKTMVDQLEVDTEIPITIDLLITMKDLDTKMSTSTEEDKSQLMNLEEGMHQEVVLQGEISVVEKEVEEAAESSFLEVGVK